jgi:hypothetical protein
VIEKMRSNFFKGEKVAALRLRSPPAVEAKAINLRELGILVGSIYSHFEAQSYYSETQFQYSEAKSYYFEANS